MPPQLENKRFSCGSLTSHKKIIAMILKPALFFYYQALVVLDSQLRACSLTQLSDRCWLFWLWCIKIFFPFAIRSAHSQDVLAQEGVRKRWFHDTTGDYLLFKRASGCAPLQEGITCCICQPQLDGSLFKLTLAGQPRLQIWRSCLRDSFQTV